MDGERRTTIIHKRLDAAVSITLAMMMAMAAGAPLGMVMVIMVVAIMVFVMMVMLVMVVMMGFLLFLLCRTRFKQRNPSCRSSDTLKVKLIVVEKTVEVDIGIVTLYDACMRLQSAYDSAKLGCLLITYFGYLVEQYYITELYLLDYQTLYILFVGRMMSLVLLQNNATAKLVAHAQGIDNCYYALQTRHTVTCIFLTHLRDSAYCLCYGSRLADTAGLDDYGVEIPGGYKLGELIDEIHAQRAAYAPVLQRHQVVRPGATDHSAALYQVGVDVHLTDIIDYHGIAHTVAIVEYVVEKSCLAAAQITCNQQHRSDFIVHIVSVLTDVRLKPPTVKNSH